MTCRTILCSIVLFAISVASPASADISVWFELVSSDVSVTAIDQGIGKALLLSDPKEVAPFSVTARMLADIPGQVVLGTSTRLAADYGVKVDSMMLTAPALGVVTPGFGQGVYGPGDIASNFGAATFIPSDGFTGSNVDLGTITFTIDPQLGAYALGEITARIGIAIWGLAPPNAQDPPEIPILRYGEGAFVAGNIVDAGEATVIRFAPEPSTLCLLAVPFATLRRRRSTRS
ncbi:MAG TPA: hypothetical protein P5081_05455 [Phycisphaerae bacterium]|nr:hypothetical protein [Phycisphaerae bacterium]HRW52313.1 hypothetical protein [Phycisphaerae bacterium]